MTTQAIVASQNRIAEMLATKAEGCEWKEVVLSFEADGAIGAETTNWVLFAVCMDGQQLEKRPLFLEFDDEELLLELRTLYSDDGGNWSTTEIHLQSDGRVNFDFDYGLPKRLNGDLAAMRKFENYLDNYDGSA